ncbi:MAG: CPBP family intramembrane metalloprotease [Chloroflexi bacterium]|nr:CPBP family intramembrane metalloprotease [Chloroflexota bacterium]
MSQAAVTQGKGCARWFVREGRLRSGWRVALYLVVARLFELLATLALGLVLGLVIGLILSQQGATPDEIGSRVLAYFQNVYDNPPLILSFLAERLVVILGVVWLFRRFLDKRSLRSLGFELTRGWWQEFLRGFAYSTLGWAVIFALSLTFGAATIVGLEWSSGNWGAVAGGLGYGLLLNILVGFAEETDARGYVLQNLAEGIRFWPAVLISSLYFGLLHLLNPGAGLTSTVGIFFAGVLLALGYYATGRLWFSIGMHAAWNFAEGPIFGFLVSGLDMGGLFELRIIGPDWLMGGGFGPEAGALAVTVEVVMIIGLFLWARKRQLTNGK